MSSADFNGSTYLTKTLPAAQPFTVMCRARVTNGSGAGFGPYFIGTADAFLIGVHSGKWAYGSGSSDVDTTATQTNNAWAFLCLQRSGNDWAIYIDGNATAGATGTNNTDSSTTFVIGDSNGTGSLTLQGQIADVMIYTAVLAVPEIQAQYRAGRKPVRHANIWFWNSGIAGASLATDMSGVGGNFTTAAGTLSHSSEDPGVPMSRRRAIWLPAPSLDQSASAPLDTSTPSFPTAGVTAGSVTGTAPLITSTATLPTAGVTASATVTAPQLASAPAFPAPTATPGSVQVTASILVSAPAFASPTATPGSVQGDAAVLISTPAFPTAAATSSITGTAPALTDAPTFPAPTATPGPVTGSAPLLASAPATPSPTATPGSVSGTAPLLSSSSVLFDATGALDGTVSPPLVQSTTSLPSPSATVGSVSAGPPLLDSAATLPSPTVTGTSSDQSASAPLTLSSTSFLSPSVSNSDQVPAPPALVIAPTFPRPTVTGGISFHGPVTVVSSERRYSIRSVRLLPEGE